MLPVTSLGHLIQPLLLVPSNARGVAASHQTQQSLALHRQAPGRAMVVSGQPVMVMIPSAIYLGTPLLPLLWAVEAQVSASGSILMITYLGTPEAPLNPAPLMRAAIPISTFLETRPLKGQKLLVDILAKEGVCSCLDAQLTCFGF